MQTHLFTYKNQRYYSYVVDYQPDIQFSTCYESAVWFLIYVILNTQPDLSLLLVCISLSQGMFITKW